MTAGWWSMNDTAMNSAFPCGASEPDQRVAHARRDGRRRLGLEQHEPVAPERHHEIDLDTLLSSKGLHLAPSPGARLQLGDFRRHEPLEDRPAEAGTTQHPLRLDPEEVTGEPGVHGLHTGRADQPVAEVLVKRRDEQVLPCRLENAEPFGDGRHRDPERGREIRLVQHLPASPRDHTQESAEVARSRMELTARTSCSG